MFKTRNLSFEFLLFEFVSDFVLCASDFYRQASMYATSEAL
jgi:hypothetical protein